MAQNDQESQPWDNTDSSLFKCAVTIAASSLLAGILIGVYLSKKNERENVIPLTEKHTSTSAYQDDPGNFVILENNTTSITFNGFEGELVWYESHEGNHFHPMGHAVIEDKKPIQVPEKAVAFLKKGKSIGETYGMDATSGPTY
jgi:hypothetical protein